jgi:HlyD family secretion protein
MFMSDVTTEHPMKERWNTIRRWTWRLLKVVMVLAVIVSVVYWVRFAPVSVTQHQVQQGEIVAEVMGTGTLEAHVKATVSSKISGRIVKVLVDQGDRVHFGQLLVRLDDEELKQQVAIAQANQETAQAAIERLKADKLRATAVANQAGTHHDRVQTLVEKNAVTKEELDRSTESFAIAEAGLSRAEAAITEGQNELIAAQKTLAYHQARLSDTRVTAPFEGLIVRRQRDPGDVVVPGSSILTLISTDVLWISAWVDETEMVNLVPDQTARVIFRSEPGRSFPGKVVRLGKETDRETREFIVDVRVLELAENWAVGQRAEVYIETHRKASVVLLPAKYVVRRNDGAGVYVNANGHAVWRLVELGLRSQEDVEVIDGLKAGETIVLPIDPGNRLTDGRRIVTP